MARVRVKCWGIHYVYKSAHKDRSTTVCLSVLVNAIYYIPKYALYYLFVATLAFPHNSKRVGFKVVRIGF